MTEVTIEGLQAQLATLTAANAGQADDINKLTSDLATMTADRDAQAGHVTTLTADLGEANGTKADLLDQVKALTADNDGLKAAVADAKAAVKKAAAKPADVERLRKIGPVEGDFSAQDLLDKINAGSAVQLAFSDGRKEIGGLAPLDITGNAWALAAGGVAMRVPSLLISSTAASMVHLVGYGLFIDGKQAAYVQRMDALPMAPGRRFDITNDVVFR